MNGWYQGRYTDPWDSLVLRICAGGEQGFIISGESRDFQIWTKDDKAVEYEACYCEPADEEKWFSYNKSIKL